MKWIADRYLDDSEATESEEDHHQAQSMNVNNAAMDAVHDKPQPQPRVEPKPETFERSVATRVKAVDVVTDTQELKMEMDEEGDASIESRAVFHEEEIEIIQRRKSNQSVLQSLDEDIDDDVWLPPSEKRKKQRKKQRKRRKKFKNTPKPKRRKITRRKKEEKIQKK
eukprot:261712_1